MNTVYLNPGDSIADAAMKCRHGDTIVLRDGKYPSDQVIRKAGISIRANNMLGALIESGATGIIVYEVPDVTISGIAFSGQSERAVWLNKSDRSKVLRCRCDTTGKWGIFTSFSNDIYLDENECFGARQHGIYVSNSGDRPSITDNHCHHNQRAGIQLNGDRKQQKPRLGEGGDGIIRGAFIEGNKLDNNGLDPANRAAAFNLLVVRDSTIRGNVLENNLGGGISFGSDMPAIVEDAGSTGNLVEDNTVTQALEGLACFRAKNFSTGNIVRNNRFTAGKGGLYDVDQSSRIGLVLTGNTEAYQVQTKRREPVAQTVLDAVS